MNLIRGNNVIGLTVVSINNGKKVAKIKDIVYDPRDQRVKAFLLDEGGWFTDARILLIEDIRSIGQDAVMIEGPELIKKASEITERVASIAKDDNLLTRTVLITDTGKKLGSVSDIVFDPVSGIVEELEVSQGIKNFQSGKKTVHINQIITVGEDATIVKEGVEGEFIRQSNERGMKGAFNRFSENVSSKTPQIRERINSKTTDWDNRAENKLDELSEKTKPKINQMMDKLQEAAESAKNSINAARKDLKEAKETDPAVADENPPIWIKTGQQAPQGERYQSKGGETEYSPEEDETVPPNQGEDGQDFIIVGSKNDLKKEE